MAVNPAHASAVPQITGAIRQAAQSTGISFEYLLTTAKIESNLNPSAQASTSSAKGLYQFIDQTWLGTMKQDGATLGLGRYADAITRAPGGHYEVADPAMRAAILRLRTDPQASAMLAGALTRNNAALVGTSIGRKPSNGELYIAHFLGADGAGKLINGAASRPQASAAAMFPHAAAANHNIFYDSRGRARSIGEVYGKLTSLFDSAQTVAFAQGGVTQPAVARSGGAPPLPPAVTVAALPVKAVPARAARVTSAASTGANPDARYGRDNAGTRARPRAIACTSGAASVLRIHVHRSGESALGTDCGHLVGDAAERWSAKWARRAGVRPVQRHAAQ
ncbi:MAG TPA: transglycosylase SLT domain-containing protein [Pseudolabrys sp.]|nr:transglycosylase SLT domain-containing protein [Pseudolabrys sp.]